MSNQTTVIRIGTDVSRNETGAINIISQYDPNNDVSHSSIGIFKEPNGKYALDVSGVINCTAVRIVGGAINAVSSSSSSSGGGSSSSSSSSSNGILEVTELKTDSHIAFKKGTDEIARFENNFLGIGTQSPKVTLHIAELHGDVSGIKSVNTNNNSSMTNSVTDNHKHFRHNVGTLQLSDGPDNHYDYFFTNGNNWKDISIFSVGSVLTRRAIITARDAEVSSDSRIKTNITDICDNEALDILNQLKPKRYGYKDVVSRGTTRVFGFIAQEVAELIPNAVTIRNEYIPNVYQLATVSDETLTFSTDLSLSSITDVSSGKIKIFDYNDKEHYIDISSTTANTMTLSEPSQITNEMKYENQIFVYGELINDFHYLKKEMIIPIAVGAIQEVVRQQQIDKAKISSLQTQLDTELADIKARLAAAGIA